MDGLTSYISRSTLRYLSMHFCLPSATHAMKILVSLAFLLIIGSLTFALWFLMRDQGKSNRTVYALTWRVGFSVLLFIMLLLGYKSGLIQPTGIY